MSKPKPWTLEQYKAIVADNRAGAYSLRSVAHGFAAKDGFDLRRVDEWTPSMKRRVRESYKEMKRLTEQNTAPVRRLSREHLRRAQVEFHGRPTSRFKVVFTPPDYAKPPRERVDKRTGEIWREPQAPHLVFHKKKVIMKSRAFTRMRANFDLEALIEDSDAEIRRAAEEMPGANEFFIAFGGDDDVSVMQSLEHGDLDSIIEQIEYLMDRYDGVKSLNGTNHAGDDPRQHSYDRWLKGLWGYRLEEVEDEESLGQMILRERERKKEARRVENNRMRRKTSVRRRGK